MGLAAQSGSYEKVADILNGGEAKVQKYFKSWFLTLNPNKTTSEVFHLSNRDTCRKLDLIVQDTKLYLRVKLDATLTFNKHLEDV